MKVQSYGNRLHALWGAPDDLLCSLPTPWSLESPHSPGCAGGQLKAEKSQGLSSRHNYSTRNWISSARTIFKILRPVMLEGRQVGPVEMLSWKKDAQFLAQKKFCLGASLWFWLRLHLKIYKDTVCTFILYQNTNSDFLIALWWNCGSMIMFLIITRLWISVL